MSTISDVAQAAGVSVATVSRALRGLDRVSPTTRENVLRAAVKLHYVASPPASSLASGRTRVIGVVTPFLNRWFFAALISSIEKTIREHALHVLLFGLEDSVNERLLITSDMLWKRVDGLIALNVTMTQPEAALLRRLRLPLVTVGNAYPGWPSVRIDDVVAVTTGVEHLVALGHREIAFAGAVHRPNAYGRVPMDRRRSFVEAMRDHDLAVRRSWIRRSDWTASDAARDAMKFLSHQDRPTAVLAASDEIALGVMASAMQLGVRVPEELSVVGIDDHPFADAFGLTTVRQDVDAQGRAAVSVLMRQLGAPNGSDTGETLFPTSLVQRRSTAPPAGGGAARGQGGRYEETSRDDYPVLSSRWP